MHVFRNAAIVTAATSLLALGAVAGSGGAALASPSPQWITGCSTYVTHPGGQTPNCAAADGTVVNPTLTDIIVNTSALAALIAAVPGEALDTSWTLSCVVNGSVVTVPGSYDITTVDQDPQTDIYPEVTVGSPAPSSCTISDLIETVSKPLYGHLAHELSPFTIGVAAGAQTAVPGAIYQDEPGTGPGGHAKLCADDTANGNAGSKIQAYQCVSDRAEAFVQTGLGQLVHNGDCLSLSGGKAILAACTIDDTAQEWTQVTAGGPVKNVQTRTCLTASSKMNGTQLTVTACGNRTDQKWHLPAMSAYVAPCAIRATWRANTAARAAGALRALC